MKTFGLFMLILLFVTLFCGLLGGFPEAFSNGEQFIIIMLTSWIMYKLTKEYK